MLIKARTNRQKKPQPPRLIMCRTCKHIVTNSSEKIEMAGSHIHVFENPAKIVFEIGCFRKAPGCQAIGTPTKEFTWFSGWAWQIAICRNCFEHLGWLYTGDASSSSFYGLILERLIEDEAKE